MTTSTKTADPVRAAKQAAGRPAQRGDVVLRVAPYDPRRPDAAPPARLRADTRIPDQGLTAFTVEVLGVPAGRVRMVEFEDVRGWFYQAETLPGPKGGCQRIGEPFTHRLDAVEAVRGHFAASA